MYYTPDNWLLEGGPLNKNYELSQKDIEWLQKKYPKNGIRPQLTVKFIESGPLWDNSSSWKKYWVKKVVQEKLMPYIGVNYIFVNEDGSLLNPITDENLLNFLLQDAAFYFLFKDFIVQSLFNLHH